MPSHFAARGDRGGLLHHGHHHLPLRGPAPDRPRARRRLPAAPGGKGAAGGGQGERRQGRGRQAAGAAKVLPAAVLDVHRARLPRPLDGRRRGSKGGRRGRRRGLVPLQAVLRVRDAARRPLARGVRRSRGAAAELAPRHGGGRDAAGAALRGGGAERDAHRGRGRPKQRAGGAHARCDDGRGRRRRRGRGRPFEGGAGLRRGALRRLCGLVRPQAHRARVHRAGDGWRCGRRPRAR
mmetsp:Transcript_29577/g.88238  ORF Transcript_29577/g.88238 Transcript_29577/m.88238 type:complete len:237 (+) Transcript_29577:527-1237(+)